MEKNFEVSSKTVARKRVSLEWLKALSSILIINSLRFRLDNNKSLL
jgi:hypothetical protein